MSLRLSSHPLVRRISSRALSTSAPPPAEPAQTTPKPKPATTPILDTIIRVISAGNDARRPTGPLSQAPSARSPMARWDPATFDPSRASPVSPGDFHADALLRNSGGAPAATGALDQARAEWNKQLLSVAGRRWREGDLYTPRDLGPKEAAKWSFAVPRSRIDPFKMMGRNPLSFYKNFSVIDEYRLPSGRVMARKKTGLSPKNQRLMAKTIRRAIGIGLIPSSYQHPMLTAEADMVPRNAKYF